MWSKHIQVRKRITLWYSFLRKRDSIISMFVMNIWFTRISRARPSVKRMRKRATIIWTTYLVGEKRLLLRKRWVTSQLHKIILMIRKKLIKLYPLHKVKFCFFVWMIKECVHDFTICDIKLVTFFEKIETSTMIFPRAWKNFPFLNKLNSIREPVYVTRVVSNGSALTVRRCRLLYKLRIFLILFLRRNRKQQLHSLDCAKRYCVAGLPIRTSQMQYPVFFIKRIQAHKGDINPKHNYPHLARDVHKRP